MREHYKTEVYKIPKEVVLRAVPSIEVIHGFSNGGAAPRRREHAPDRETFLDRWMRKIFRD